MSIRWCILVLALLTGPVTLSSVRAQTATVNCQTAVFSDKVLTRFPNIRSVCLGVIQREGAQFAVIKVQLIRVESDTLRVRVMNPDGSFSGTRSIPIGKEFRALVEGKATRASELAADQQLTAYVKVTEPVLALEPAEPTEHFAYVPLQAPESVPLQSTAQSTARMPTTGTDLPAVLWFGLSLMAAAVMLRMRRFR